jgi:hypothetical protein
MYMHIYIPHGAFECGSFRSLVVPFLHGLLVKVKVLSPRPCANVVKCRRAIRQTAVRGSAACRCTRTCSHARADALLRYTSFLGR